MQIDDIVLMGISHKTASVELREKTALSETVCLQGMGHLIAAGVISEILIYSTCNRLEFLYVAQNHEKAQALIRYFLKAHTNVSDYELESCFYLKTGLNAVKHIFRVAASLDSMVMGEPQILGQIKNAYRLALQARSTGVILNRLLHKTFFTAKKIRTETAIGRNPVSVSHAAVDLAKNELNDLSRCRVLLIGAGEMGTLAAQKIAQHQPQAFFIANRTYDKARALALSLNGEAVLWHDLLPATQKVDLIVASTVSNNYILWYNDFLNRIKPLVVIDIGMPRNVDPAINELAACKVYDLDNVQSIVEQNRLLRENEALAAENIIEAEALGFERGMRDFAVKPTMLALRGKLHDIVMQEMAKLPLDVAARKEAEKTADIIVNRFLHNPVQSLKMQEHKESQALYLDMMRKLFDLDT